MPCEVRQPLGLFKGTKGAAPAEADWEWAIKHRSASAKLWRDEPRYQTASMAFHDCQFIDHLPMCVALTWAGIEALFATQGGEATFRMAAYIAALLEPRGTDRIDLHRRISKGYGTRSAIVHGRSRPSHDVLVEHLRETRTILYRLLCCFVEMQKLPNQKELDELIHS